MDEEYCESESMYLEIQGRIIALEAIAALVPEDENYHCHIVLWGGGEIIIDEFTFERVKRLMKEHFYFLT